jgi:hypothetical protein
MTVRGVLAQIEVRDAVVSWQKLSDTTRDAILIFGTLTLVVLIMVIWAIYFRKRRRDRSHDYEYPSGSANGEASSQKRRKWRRRRRDHRPRNPTLAETGGLPPARSDEPPRSHN